MQFKALEINVDFGEHNASMFAIEKRADSLVNKWLAEHPRIVIHHVRQSLADINDSVVLQFGIFYDEASE